MDPSIVLAKFWGVTLFVTCGGLLLNKKLYFEFVRASKIESIALISGLVAVLSGAFLVSIYNVWSFDYRGLLTLLGWLTLLKGVAVFIVPKSALSLARRVKSNDSLFYSSVGVSFLIGLYMLYIGFLS
ncbi:hypothetical protein HY024_04875 [Candidatus Curtissbacteria bacterium]|nr:hypothetical protein [Candidatus Curtissbacteria bacterium]